MFPFYEDKKQSKVVAEAALPMNTSHDALRGHIRKALRVAHNVPDNSYSDQGPWVSDVFPGHVVYQMGGATMKRSYTSEQGAAGTEPAIKLGDAKKVHVAYVDTKDGAKEALTVCIAADPSWTDVSEKLTPAEKPGVIITLPAGAEMVSESISIADITEGAGSANVPARVPIKIIGPGWGAMAHYSEAMIKTSGPQVFTKGTHMYWNHPTSTQEAERPERDINDLAAVLTKDAYWDSKGAKGPGLYSEAKVFSDYSQQVSEKGPHIGVSILAAIQGHVGEADGRTGKIADKFVHAYSTDFVTKAGAKGAPVVQESAGGPTAHEESQAMTEQEITTLQAENTKLKESNASLLAQQNKILAVATVGTILREADVSIRQSMLERVCENPVMEGEKVSMKWAQAVAADLMPETGGVRGHGGATPIRESTRTTDKTASETKLREALSGLGTPKAGLDFAVNGRV